MLGSKKSDKKSEASKMNGRKGGRPKNSHINMEFLKAVKEVVEDVFPKILVETPKCQSPYCPRIDTKEYQRSTGTFWLCDTHKP